VKITAFDLVHLLDGVERVSASKIPDAQKTLVLTELRNAVPEPIFCAASLETRDYVLQTIEGAIHGCAEKTKSQIPVKKGTRASPTESPEEKLLPDTNGDGRGKSVETKVVNQTPKKRGKATRSS
jgi:hypothetical protein